MSENKSFIDPRDYDMISTGFDEHHMALEDGQKKRLEAIASDFGLTPVWLGGKFESDWIKSDSTKEPVVEEDVEEVSDWIKDLTDYIKKAQKD